MTREGMSGGGAEQIGGVPEERKILAGPLDVLVIYHHEAAGTYHPAWYQEHPMPGPLVPYNELEFVRLFSKMHHATGSPTLEGAQQLLEEMRRVVAINDLNVDLANPVPWDGQIGDVMVVPNWRKRGAERPFASLREEYSTES